MADIIGKVVQRKAVNGAVGMAKTVYENDYELLKNHPSIKGVVLIGDISLEDLGLAADGITIVSDGVFLRVKDDSHSHIIDNIEGLRLILDGKAEASELITMGNGIAAHVADKDNPHGTTAEQVGLGNVENLAANDLAPTYSDVSELETISSGERLSSVFAKIKLAVSQLISHFADKGNPHNVTKTQLGLGKVENKSSADILGELTKDYIVALGIPGQDTNTTYGAVTASANGLATPEMLTKLNGIAAGANKYVHPAYTAKSSGLYKITVDATGHVSAVAAVTKADITGLGIPGQDTNTTYGAVTASANGLATPEMLTKLNGIAAGANKYVHPAYTAKSSGLYKITVDATGHVSAVAAVTKADITGLGIPGQDTNTTYGAVTESANGLATSAMLTKLNGIAAGANKYIHPAYTPKSSGLYKITVDATGHVSAVAAVTKADITALGIPGQDTNTTYGAVTESANGLATPAMLTKLNGIAAGANKYVHPAYTAKSSGLYKITIDATGHVSAVAAVTKADITALGIPGQDTNTTYGAVTESANGLATPAMLTKLNSIGSASSIIAQASPMEDYFKAF